MQVEKQVLPLHNQYQGLFSPLNHQLPFVQILTETVYREKSQNNILKWRCKIYFVRLSFLQFRAFYTECDCDCKLIYFSILILASTARISFSFPNSGFMSNSLISVAKRSNTDKRTSISANRSMLIPGCFL